MVKKEKRNLFAELSQGVGEMKAHGDGKMTLRTVRVSGKRNPVKVDADFIRETREKLHMSRGVFALAMRISPRTLEKWEQGKTVPNDQASVLILLTRKYPDTLRRLAKI